MLFNGKTYRSKIAALEAELASFYEAEQDLRQEMIYFSLDEVGNFIEVGKGFSDSLGYSAGEVINDNIRNIILEKSLSREHTLLMFAAIKNKTHWHGALQLKNKKVSKFGIAS